MISTNRSRHIHNMDPAFIQSSYMHQTTGRPRQRVSQETRRAPNSLQHPFRSSHRPHLPIPGSIPLRVHQPFLQPLILLPDCSKFKPQPLVAGKARGYVFSYSLMRLLERFYGVSMGQRGFWHGSGIVVGCPCEDVGTACSFCKRLWRGARSPPACFQAPALVNPAGRCRVRVGIVDCRVAAAWLAALAACLKRTPELAEGAVVWQDWSSSTSPARVTSSSSSDPGSAVLRSEGEGVRRGPWEI